MRFIWRLVLIITVAMITVGLCCAAVALITGASVERMIEIFFGSREAFDLTLQILREELASLF